MTAAEPRMIQADPELLDALVSFIEFLEVAMPIWENDTGLRPEDAESARRAHAHLQDIYSRCVT